MIYDRIKELCKENGISVNELEKRIGVAKGYLCKVDKHKPSMERTKALADELHTSVDYLITGMKMDIVVEMAEADVALSNMDKRLKEYALKLAELPKDKQEHIMELIDILSGGK